MHRLGEQQGFTLIELAVAAVLTVVLSVVAVSSYHSDNQITEARAGMRDQLIKNVNMGSTIGYIKNLALAIEVIPYLPYLDNQAGGWCTTSNPCLDNISGLSQTDGSLFKFSTSCYGFDAYDDGVINGANSATNPDWCFSYSASTGVAEQWLGQNTLCSDTNCNNTVEENASDDEEEDDDDDEDEDDDDEDSLVICHKGSTMTINVHAWGGHQGHGDLLGACDDD